MLPWKADGKAVPRVSGRRSSRDGPNAGLPKGPRPEALAERSANKTPPCPHGRKNRSQCKDCAPDSYRKMKTLRDFRGFQKLDSWPANLVEYSQRHAYDQCCQMDSPLCRGSSFRSSDSRGACSCHVQARAVDRPARSVRGKQENFLMIAQDAPSPDFPRQLSLLNNLQICQRPANLCSEI